MSELANYQERYALAQKVRRLSELILDEDMEIISDNLDWFWSDLNEAEDVLFSDENINDFDPFREDED